MRGRIHSVWVVTCLVLGAVWACAPAAPYQPTSVRAGSSTEAAHVVVVKSGDNPLFTAPVTTTGGIPEQLFMETSHGRDQSRCDGRDS